MAAEETVGPPAPELIDAWSPNDKELTQVPTAEVEQYRKAGWSVGEDARKQSRYNSHAGELMTGIAGAAHGATGGLSDVLLKHLPSTITGGIEQDLPGMREANPKSDLAGNIVGSVAPFVATGGAAAELQAAKALAGSAQEMRLAAQGSKLGARLWAGAKASAMQNAIPGAARVATGAALAGTSSAIRNGEFLDLSDPANREQIYYGISHGALWAGAAEVATPVIGSLASAGQKAVARKLATLAKSDAFKKTVTRAPVEFEPASSTVASEFSASDLYGPGKAAEAPATLGDIDVPTSGLEADVPPAPAPAQAPARGAPLPPLSELARDATAPTPAAAPRGVYEPPVPPKWEATDTLPADPKVSRAQGRLDELQGISDAEDAVFKQRKSARAAGETLASHKSAFSRKEWAGMRAEREGLRDFLGESEAAAGSEVDNAVSKLGGPEAPTPAPELPEVEPPPTKRKFADSQRDSQLALDALRATKKAERPADYAEQVLDLKNKMAGAKEEFSAAQKTYAAAVKERTALLKAQERAADLHVREQARAAEVTRRAAEQADRLSAGQLAKEAKRAEQEAAAAARGLRAAEADIAKQAKQAEATERAAQKAQAAFEKRLGPDTFKRGKRQATLRQLSRSEDGIPPLPDLPVMPTEEGIAEQLARKSKYDKTNPPIPELGRETTRYDINTEAANNPTLLGIAGKTIAAAAGVKIPFFGTAGQVAAGQSGLSAAQDAAKYVYLRAAQHELNGGFGAQAVFKFMAEPGAQALRTVVQSLLNEPHVKDFTHHLVGDGNIEKQYEAVTTAANNATANPQMLADYNNERYGPMMQREPELYQGLLQHQGNVLQSIKDAMPADNRPAAMVSEPYVPPRAQQVRVLQTALAVTQPYHAMANPTAAGMKAVERIAPATLARARQLVMAQLADPKVRARLTPDQMKRLSLFMGGNIRPQDDPKFRAGLQQVATQTQQPEQNNQQKSAPTLANGGKSFVSSITTPMQQRALDKAAP